jgi:hypothetical protein
VATTLAQLEQRVQALEAAVAALREGLANGPSPVVASAPRARRTVEPPENPLVRDARLNAIFQQMGITGEAPGIEKLREMMAAHGVHAGDEAVRQEIAAMRDQQEEDE